jgi:hypothetical protein
MEENQVMEQPIPLSRPARVISTALLVSAILLSCGLTALAAEEGSPEVQQTTSSPIAKPIPPSLPITTPMPPPLQVTAPLPQSPWESTVEKLYPADMHTVVEDGKRQIVMTYILAAEQAHADIPRAGFTRDGWRFELTDITEKRSSGTDTRIHTETVEISTDTKNLNEIIKLLKPTLDYQGEDGYCGLLTLDLSTVTCKAAGYKKSSYTVTATREYPHLSTNDLSLIPKTITDNGKTLALDGVTWEVQQYISVDYEDIPDCYRAVAKYSAKASRRVVTGYTTTADYTGEVSRTVLGNTIYTLYFSGSEINPVLGTIETPPPTTETQTTKPNSEPLIAGLITETRATKLDTELSIKVLTTETPATDLSTEQPATMLNAEPIDTGLTTETQIAEMTKETPTTWPVTSSPTQASQISNFPVGIFLIGVAVIAALLAGAGVFWFLMRNNVKVYKVSNGHRALAAEYKIIAKSPVIDLSSLEGNCFAIVIGKFAAKTNNSRTITIRRGGDWMEHQIAYEGNIYNIEVDFSIGELKVIY